MNINVDIQGQTVIKEELKLKMANIWGASFNPNYILYFQAVNLKLTHRNHVVFHPKMKEFVRLADKLGLLVLRRKKERNTGFLGNKFSVAPVVWLEGHLAKYIWAE